MDQHSSPATPRKTAKFVAAGLLVPPMLVISGLTLTGTVLGLALTTPLFVLFSPILVITLIITLMIITGFVFTGGCGVVAFTGFNLLYKYAKGKRPVGTDHQHDYMEEDISKTAKEMKDLLKSYIKDGQNNKLN